VKNPPSFEAVETKVREICAESLVFEGELDCHRPLIAELGFDSLDMIEVSFALEEFFGVEFASRNAITELDRILGGERILAENKLTELGRKLVFERMPELADVDLPEDLAVSGLPGYFTVQTFARIIHDFYAQAPDSCPETGEEVVLDDFQLVLAKSRESVDLPAGDVLMQSWLDAKASELELQGAGVAKDG